MDIQLQQGNSNHYCFVSVETRKSRGRRRGEFWFVLQFVDFIPVPGGDGDNKPVETKRLNPAQFHEWFL